MKIAGVDGCRKGWIIIRNRKDEIDFHIHKSFSELMDMNQDLDRIFIDIPLGLPDRSNPRTIEKILRKELKSKAPSVFNVPVRDAVYETADKKAREINIEQTGKSLSIQSLNIRNKIKEVDLFLLSTSPGIEIYESHPEFVFSRLNPAREIIFTKKSTKAGADERLKILENYEKGVRFLLRKIERETLRKDVRRDDILDAFCLFTSNKLAGKSNISFLKDNPVQKIRGREIKIAYHSS